MTNTQDITLFRADGIETTLSEIEADAEAAKMRYSSSQFCFSWVTVESLCQALREQQLLIEQMKKQ